jgi:GntR family transcriptional regulator, L-lactate dehydrogenase operon regulator
MTTDENVNLTSLGAGLKRFWDHANSEGAEGAAGPSRSHVPREFGQPTVELPQFEGRGVRTAADQALLDLVEALRLGAIGHGDRLPPLGETSEALSVSVSNLRVALRELEKAGVLEVRPGRGGGVFITDLARIPYAVSALYPPVPEAEVGVILEAMFLTELNVAFLAARRGTADDFEFLRTRLDIVEQVGTTPLDYSERTVRFQLAVASIAKNEFLRKQFAELMNRVAFVTARRGDLRGITVTDVEHSVEQYRALFEGILSRDAEKISEAVDARAQFQYDLRRKTTGEPQ